MIEKEEEKSKELNEKGEREKEKLLDFGRGERERLESYVCGLGLPIIVTIPCSIHPCLEPCVRVPIIVDSQLTHRKKNKRILWRGSNPTSFSVSYCLVTSSDTICNNSNPPLTARYISTLASLF